MTIHPAKLMLAVASSLAGAFSLSAVCRTAHAHDWPTFQADNTHSGFSSQTVGEPFRLRWRWHETTPAGRSQPVISNGRVFLGGMDGRFFAIDSRTGKTAWSFRSDGPVLASAAVSGSRVFFDTGAGSVYALEASTGKRLWQFRAEGRGGFWAAPAVEEGLALLGCRDKSFYAIDASTGHLRWRFRARGWIVTPAAVGRGIVYFGAEDEMAAYALRLADGHMLWRRVLPGQTFRESWPVLDLPHRRVIFTTMPTWPFHYNLREVDYSIFQFTAGAGWPLERKSILEYLARWPTRQSVFVLDRDTGLPTQTLPVLWSGGSGGPPTPPVFRPDGSGFIIFRSTGGIQNPPRNNTVHVSSQWNSDLGALNIPENDVRSLDSSEHLIGFHLISDETSTLSLAGRNLIVESWPEIGGIDTSTGHLFTVAIPSDRSDLVGAAVNNAPGVPRVYGAGETPSPSPSYALGLRPAPVADGVIYWIWNGTLAALEGTIQGEERGPWAIRSAQ